MTLPTAIAQADHAAGVLRYRGVDVADLVGRVGYGDVWGLLVDGRFGAGLPPAEHFPLPVHTGDVRVDVQVALAQLAPVWGFRPLLDTGPEEARDQLRRAATMVLSFVAQSARGRDLPAVPERRVDQAETVVGRFLTRWRGEPDPQHVAAIDAYFTLAAEHGLNPSTMTARAIASTGADVAAALSGAVAAVSGPLHGGAPARAWRMLHEARGEDDLHRYVRGVLDSGRRLMGFRGRTYAGEDPRVTLARALCATFRAPLYDIALGLERAALDVLAERDPEHPPAVTLEFWTAVLLDGAGVPQRLFTPMFVCARSAGWSAHILEEQTAGALIRPTSTYVGPGPRRAQDVPGWADLPVRPPLDS